jgi:hypothetical protein
VNAELAVQASALHAFDAAVKFYLINSYQITEIKIFMQPIPWVCGRIGCTPAWSDFQARTAVGWGLAAPVTFDPDVASTGMAPVTGNPDGVGARRLSPSAGDPDVTGTVPAVIAADPGPARVRPRAGMFDDYRRRTDAHDDLLRE